MSTKKLICCTGLPGSGKSTWAEEQRKANPTNVCVVNKDQIRGELEQYGWKWSHENEKDVIKIRDERIIDAFKRGCTLVISDDTNFGKVHKARLQQLAGENKAEFEIHKFTTPVDECIRRDSLREGKKRVGEKVIMSMALNNGLLGQLPTNPEMKVEPYKPDKLKKSAIICDLDGTLALNDHGRSFYDASECDKDKCCDEVKVILEVFYRFMGWDIAYVSGRSDAYRDKTGLFLRVNHCPPGALFMRKDGDYRKDWIIKKEIFEEHIKNNYYVRFVLDDRKQCIDLWRGMGIKTFQCANGDF